jgi:hypothetical protein
VSEREKSAVSEMIGEFLREIAVLLLVFVPLEAYKGTNWETGQLVLAVSGTILGALAIFAAGVFIERRRP